MLMTFKSGLIIDWGGIQPGEQLLIGNGTVSHQQAMEKVETEYKKYKAKTLSDVEKDYLALIENLEKEVKK